MPLSIKKNNSYEQTMHFLNYYKLVVFDMARGKAVCKELRNLIIDKRKKGISIRKISKEVNIPISTIAGIIRNFKIRKTVEVKRKSGRKCKFTSRDLRKLVAICRKNRRSTVRDITEKWSQEVCKPVSRETTRKWIHKLGYGFYKVV